MLAESPPIPAHTGLALGIGDHFHNTQKVVDRLRVLDHPFLQGLQVLRLPLLKQSFNDFNLPYLIFPYLT